MKDWLIETIDQIALGEFLANSKVSCGQKFGLIAVDNAVEFMLIVDVELKRQIVGGQIPEGILQKDWDKIKRAFPDLLEFVASKEPNLKSLKDEINRYHDLRNSLYHLGKPITIRASLVTEYSKLARNVLKVLFALSFSSDEWNEVVKQIALSLTGGTRSIKHSVAYEQVEDIVRFVTLGSPTIKEAIALCLYGYAVNTANPPARATLLKSLSKSGRPTVEKVLNARVFDMRKEGWIQKGDLRLKQKAISAIPQNSLFD